MNKVLFSLLLLASPAMAQDRDFFKEAMGQKLIAEINSGLAAQAQVAQLQAQVSQLEAQIKDLQKKLEDSKKE